MPGRQRAGCHAAHLRVGTVSSQTRRFSVKGLPHGYAYLVAVHRLPDRRYGQVRFKRPSEMLDQPAVEAARIFVGHPGKIELTLPQEPRQN
jgi:hypothetical protein